MSDKVNLIFLAGSSRKDSANKKLAKYAASEASKIEGVNAEFIDLKDYEMPIYNGDLEEESGLPENAIKLKEKFINADGFFLACPEYNSSITPLLKNSIDWISRPHKENEAGLVAFKGKVAAISSASPGALGGLRGLVSVRSLLGNIGATVTPTQVAVAKAHEAFDETGSLTSSYFAKSTANQISELAETTRKLKG